MEPLYVSPVTGAEYDCLYTLEFAPGGFASFKSYDEVQAFRAKHKITGTLYTPDGYPVDEHQS